LKAIIPVAGLGTRFEPHTQKVQKCLLPVAGKPILEHILDPLINVGICDFTLIIGHLGEQVVEFTNQYPKEIKFQFAKQSEQLGLGHAIYQGLSEESANPVLVILGDSIFKMDFAELIKSPNSTLGVFEVENPSRYGIVEHKNGLITNLVEKPENPRSNLAIAGVYFVKSEAELLKSIQYLIENNIRTHGEFQLTDALQHLVRKEHMFNIAHVDCCLDCGVPQTMLDTNKFLLEKQINSISNTAEIMNSTVTLSTVSDNCKIENSNLNNVIMFENSVVKNINLSNKIIGFNEILTGN
jgi:glucose-1-phosphate thymidylyltransferase